MIFYYETFRVPHVGSRNAERRKRLKTIALVLAYDGTPFAGWQRQEGKRTIQGCLEEAVSRINHAPTQVRGASRTDAGVHAEYQIAAFETPRDYPPERWRQALNSTTPAEICVRSAQIAPDGFQPRFASRGKHYRYWLYQDHFLPPQLLCRAAHTMPLDLDNMRKAARYLIGEHDFSSFRAADCQAKSPVRTISEISISVAAQPYVYALCDANRLIQIDVKGTAFLKQMVRIIVGTLIEFGQGRPAEDMSSILAARSRAKAGQTAPAAGLTLVRSFSDLPWLEDAP